MAKRRIPKYSCHKATNQARVFLDGKDHYLGEYGFESSKKRYEELIDEWQIRQDSPTRTDLSIGELILLYDNHSATYYVKNG